MGKTILLSDFPCDRMLKKKLIMSHFKGSGLLPQKQIFDARAIVPHAIR
jgi:hypothetical protein